MNCLSEVLSWFYVPFLQIDCVVCSYCFRFIGSIEFQIGRRLYLQSLGGSVDGTTERHCHGNDAGSSTGCSGASSGNSNAVPQEVLMSLMDGNTSLPLTDQFCLPSVVACPGGCEGELYCRFVFLTICEFFSICKVTQQMII